MKQVLPTSAALLLLAATSALAADLKVKAPVAPPPPVFTWAGFYVGANLGYSWGRASTDLTETLTTTATIATGGATVASATVVTNSFGNDRAKLNGVLGGFQAGYNWQFGQYLAGLEGDIQATGQRGGVTICPIAPGTAPVACPGGTLTQFGSASYRLPWFGTLRGRVGYTFDRILLYATGGLAVGEIKASYVDGFFAPLSISPLATRERI